MKRFINLNSKKNALPPTSSLAQAGVWLVRHFVPNSNPCSRPNRTESPACRQAATTLSVMAGQHVRTKLEKLYFENYRKKCNFAKILK